MLIPALMLALQAAPTATPPAPATTPSRWPTAEADHLVKAFRFGTGETMDVRMHYTTLGKPRRDARGQIDNAVMVLHGTGGSGRQFLQPQFADELYGPGQPLDIRKYWIILPDNIGHGRSSKPSDGLRMKFPQYDYDDMVALQHRLVTDGLGVKRLRLVMGTSMGCMHGFVLAETWPDFAAALMPMACEPVAIAGLNRMWRQMSIDGIKADPAWTNGDYGKQPLLGLRTAASISTIAGSAPLFLQKSYPTRDAATRYVRERVERDIASRDANDMIYQLDSSRNYDPWPGLEKIKMPVMWINSADDFINPRNLPFPAEALKRAPTVRFRMIAETDDTRGHGTHTWAKFWKGDLADLLRRTEGK